MVCNSKIFSDINARTAWHSPEVPGAHSQYFLKNFLRVSIFRKLVTTKHC